MFSTLRNRFGIPGVISVIALVFAMFGGAYAASNSSGGGKATASAKAKKGPRGPKGATGPAGPAGAQGPAGPAGAKGDAGANGSNGTNGTNGTSAEAVSFAGNQHGCSEGGTEVKSAKPATFVCNGVKGTNGTNGTTGFTETLPSGKTETGNWDATAEFAHADIAPFAISFPIPLAVPSEHVEYLTVAETEGSVGSGKCELEVEVPSAKPIAPPGYLCVFTRLREGTGVFKNIGLEAVGTNDSPAGAFIWFETPAAGKVNTSGTWAVTAPTTP